jgi:hypothetical protein
MELPLRGRKDELFLDNVLDAASFLIENSMMKFVSVVVVIVTSL